MVRNEGDRSSEVAVDGGPKAARVLGARGNGWGCLTALVMRQNPLKFSGLWRQKAAPPEQQQAFDSRASTKIPPHTNPRCRGKQSHLSMRGSLSHKRYKKTYG